MKIFGRDPAMWVALIEAALAMALSLNVFGLTHEKIALVVAVVAAVLGIYTAYVTNQTMLGVIIGLVKAVIALAVGYGFEFGPDKTAALLAFVTVLVGMYQRTQVSPVVKPNFNPRPAAPENQQLLTAA